MLVINRTDKHGDTVYEVYSSNNISFKASVDRLDALFQMQNELEAVRAYLSSCLNSVEEELSQLEDALSDEDWELGQFSE